MESVGQALLQYMQLWGIFAMLVFFASLRAPYYPLQGVQGVGSIFFAVSSLAKCQLKLVPRTRNDCFHQQWLTGVNRPQPAAAALHPGQLKNGSLGNIFFFIL